MKFLVFVFIIITSLGHVVHAQSDFYDISETRNVRIYFQQKNWDALLDSFYVQGDEERILASVVLDGTRFDSVGVRYKGFSSVSTERKKNPFNIKLDYVKNQSYQGYEKIKLSNVIQDPSFVREALSYEIARNYMVASKANFANVYINDTFWGVYTNVEAVNKQFLADRFSSKENTLFKGNPDDLDLNGENSNLNNLYGLDSTKYEHLYDLKSDAGWGDLMTLMSVLNDSVELLDNVLNIDQALWMHAFNYTFVNFDSYIGYAQNYYLYQNNNGQFYPILWDLNQSFGSFRLTDASTFFRGFSVTEAQSVDPLTHLNSFSVHPRPLIRQVLSNDTFKRMYLAHIRTMMEEYVSNDLYYERAKTIQQLIQSDVFSDVNKFYTNADFTDNLDVTVKDLVDYPGIKDLMLGRQEYLQSYPGIWGYPMLDNESVKEANDSTDVTVEVDVGNRVWLYYRATDNAKFEKVRMFDDGLHNDESNNDNVYGIRVSNTDLRDYYFYAENDSAGAFLPKRAAHEYFSVSSGMDLVINEICASNGSIISDEHGDFDDWVELYNNSGVSIDLRNYYLSDDIANLAKWQLPGVGIDPSGYTLFWLDNESEEGDMHANFKLSASGESLYLSTKSGEIVDAVSFGPQTTDITYGRILNGMGDFTLNTPTPREHNRATSDEQNTLSYVLYPNPSDNVVRLLFNQKTSGQIDIFNLNGSRVNDQVDLSNAWSCKYDVSEMVKGIYFLKVSTENSVLTKKFIIK